MADLFAPEELRSLLNQLEGQFLEFKSVWDRTTAKPKQLGRRVVRDVIAECVAAFANADGGTLLVGVEDDGTPTGHPYPDEAVHEFAVVAQRRLKPAVATRFERVVIDRVEILVVDVPIAAEAVMVGGNGFPYRVGDSIVREPQEVINERKQAYRRVGWEQRLRPDAGVADLDFDLAKRTFAASPAGSRPIEELLLRYGLLQGRAHREPAVTNAALLLFARDSTVRWHPRAGVRVFRVAGTERAHGTERNVTQVARADVPLVELLPEIQRMLRSQIRRSEKLHDLFFREVPEYPDFAWQEALVNAVAHRDYGDQGREVEVWLYDDRMEVRSPGELVPPVSLDALRSRRPVHASRNPLLVRVLVDAGIMREEGEGVPRIHEEMEASFLRPPQFDVAEATFTITLRNQPVFEGPSAEWQGIVARLPIGPGQRRILLRHPEAFTNEDYRQLNGVDRDRAYREIQGLVDLGIVVSPERSGRGAKYRVSPDLYMARGWLEARLPKLRGLLATHDFVKNADYRELFGVSRSVALRELQRLTDEGFLEMVGERRGARYVPGPGLLRSERK